MHAALSSAHVRHALALVAAQEATDIKSTLNIMAVCRDLPKYPESRLTPLVKASKMQSVVVPHQPHGFPIMYAGVKALEHAARTDDVVVAECSLRSLQQDPSLAPASEAGAQTIQAPCSLFTPFRPDGALERQKTTWVTHVKDALFTAITHGSAKVAARLREALLEADDVCSPSDVEALVQSFQDFIASMEWSSGRSSSRSSMRARDRERAKTAAADPRPSYKRPLSQCINPSEVVDRQIRTPGINLELPIPIPTPGGFS